MNVKIRLWFSLIVLGYAEGPQYAKGEHTQHQCLLTLLLERVSLDLWLEKIWVLICSFNSLWLIKGLG